jgi:5-methylcytosine-specific restriction endonuclease McrA
MSAVVLTPYKALTPEQVFERDRYTDHANNLEFPFKPLTLKRIANYRWPEVAQHNHLGSQRAKSHGGPVLCSDKEAAKNLEGECACYWCGKSWDAKRKKSSDHMIPLVMGGPHSINNVVASCISCNAKKSDKPIGASDFPHRAINDQDKLRLEKICAEMGITFEQWIFRADEENRLENLQIMDTWLKDAWILGWTGFCRPVVDLIKRQAGHGNFDQTMFRRTPAPGHKQRRTAAFLHKSSYLETKALLKSFGGIVSDDDPAWEYT